MFLITWLVFLLLWEILIRAGWRFREAFLMAHVVNAVWIVILTEFLSLFQALAFWPLLGCWALAAGILFFLLRRFPPPPKTPNLWGTLPLREKLCLISVLGIVAVTGLIALVAPPNNYDSMIYHMARVAHWAANGSLAHYPTATLMQLTIQPFSGYAVLQGYILGGSDYLANFVQWDSMVASLVGVSLIAGLLGADRRGQFFAVLLAVTLPTGILQSSGTQNDYVATLWVVTSGVFSLLLMTTGRRVWAIFSLLSLGLSTFTKGTAVLLAIPILTWALCQVKWSLKDKIVYIFLSIAFVLALNAGFLCRLSQLAANPFTAIGLGGGALVEQPDWPGMVSNLVRGAAMEVALPFKAWTDGLYTMVAAVHQALGLAVNDPRYLVYSNFFVWDVAPFIEDLAVNPLHALLYLLALLLLLIDGLGYAVRRLMPSGRTIVLGDRIRIGLLAGFVLAIAVAVVIFSAQVKWQAWLPRFHLPFFIIFAPCAAVIFSVFDRRAWIRTVIGAVLLIAAWGPLFYNNQRPLLPAGELMRAELEKTVPRGGEIFDWMMHNGFFQGCNGQKAFLNPVTSSMRARLQQAWPQEFPQVWPILAEDVLSFPGGILLAPQEELRWGRFGKLTRDELRVRVAFIRRMLERQPDCRDIGIIDGRIEYPFWALLPTASHPVRIEHVLVDNITRDIPYPRGAPRPCLLLQEGNAGPDRIELDGKNFLRCTPGPMQVYVDKEHAGTDCPAQRTGVPALNKFSN